MVKWVVHNQAGLTVCISLNVSQARRLSFNIVNLYLDAQEGDNGCDNCV